MASFKDRWAKPTRRDTSGVPQRGELLRFPAFDRQESRRTVPGCDRCGRNPRAQGTGLVQDRDRIAAITKAQQLAASGKLVVVGAKRLELKDKHGHVAVATPKVQGNWPILYGGGSGTARSPGTKTLNFVFRAEFLPLLRYSVPPTTVVPRYD